MNIFSKPAIINWQTSSAEASSTLTLRDCLTIAHNIVDSNPLIVNVQEFGGGLGEDILIEVFKVFQEKKLFVKYELDIDGLDLSKYIRMKEYIQQLSLRVYKDACFDLLTKLKDVIEDMQVEVKYVINSLNKNELTETITGLTQYPFIQTIDIIQEKFINPTCMKEAQLTRSDINEVMIDITDIATDYLDQVSIHYKDFNAEIKNLSKNRQIQFTLSIKENGDIAFNEIFNIHEGNALHNNIVTIWQDYFKEFWFHSKIKELFLDFSSIDDENFTHLIHSSKITSCKDLLFVSC